MIEMGRPAGFGKRARRFAALLGATLLLGAVAAGTASATIVWSKGGDIWAMNDDGSGQRLLIPKSAAPGMDALRTPATSAAGASVLFSGETTRNKITRTGICGTFPYTYPCFTTHYGFYFSGIYRWDGGAVQRLSPEPSYCWNCSDGTVDPEPRPDGTYVAAFSRCQGFLDDSSYDCVGSIVSSGLGPYPALCNGEGLTGTLPDGPSPNPVAPSQIVYAGCGAGGEPSALIVTDPNRAGERIVACDDVTQADPAWSPGGDAIVAAEGGAEAGLWVYGAANSGCYTGQLRHAVVAPPEVSLSSPRFVGSERIVFAAQGELWTVPASCNGCPYPGNATKLTSGADNSGPSWTSNPLLVPPPPVAPAAAADKRAPKLTIKLSKRQRILRQAGKLVLKLRADEACKVTVQGKLILPGKDLALKKVTRSLPAGKLTTVKLKLSAKAMKAVKAAWRRGKTPVAALRILAKDSSDNSVTKAPRIKLVRQQPARSAST